MAKNEFELHRQSIVAFDEPRHRRSAQSPTGGTRASPQTEKRSAATHRSMTADRELLWSYYPLLFHHGAAKCLCNGWIGVHISDLVSAIANYEGADSLDPK